MIILLFCCCTKRSIIYNIIYTMCARCIRHIIIQNDSTSDNPHFLLWRIQPKMPCFQTTFSKLMRTIFFYVAVYCTYIVKQIIFLTVLMHLNINIIQTTNMWVINLYAIRLTLFYYNLLFLWCYYDVRTSNILYNYYDYNFVTLDDLISCYNIIRHYDECLNNIL